MVAAQRVAMRGTDTRGEQEDAVAAELEDTALSTDGQDVTKHPRPLRARHQQKQQDEGSGDDDEGLQALMQRYVLVLTFLVFPETTNVVFTMLRPCHELISPVPGAYMWNDYSIQVMSQRRPVPADESPRDVFVRSEP